MENAAPYTAAPLQPSLTQSTDDAPPTRVRAREDAVMIDAELMDELVTRAIEHHDGHLTVCRFTTSWRVGFVAPNSREGVGTIMEGKTFAEAARAALETEPRLSRRVDSLELSVRS